MQRRIVSLTLLLVLIGVLAACQGVPVAPAAEAPAAAESEAPATMEAMAPMVMVADQPVVDGMVTVAKAVSAGPGWMVIHAQADGKPGPVIGHAALMDGVNENVAVEIDESAATDVLYAMLHTDVGEMGTYEFPGPDGPVKDAEGNVITPPFNVTMGEAMGEEAMAGEPVVLLGGNDELGEFLTGANGMTLYVFAKDGPGVSNCDDQCIQNWPPLLVEEGQKPTAGEGVGGELSVIERADGGMQVAHNGMPLYFWVGDAKPGDATGDGVKDVWFVARPAEMGGGSMEAMAPMVMVADQPVVDGMVTVAKAVSAGPGWMVIHAQADGKPGPVIGHAALMDGVNENVGVEIDESAATDVLYAMLHTDAGEMGTYEFPGPDGPVKDADGNVITPAFNVTMGEAMGEEAMGEGNMATIVTNGARLRVRAEPSLDAEIIGHVNNGESYEVMGVSDDGAWVNIAGVAGSPEGGWVSAQFVKMRE